MSEQQTQGDNEATIGAVALDCRVMPCVEPCSKCGSGDIYRRFIAKGGEVPHEGYDRCASKYGTGECHSWTATRDHLHHHCRCCGFVWQTPPMPMTKRKAGHNVKVTGPQAALSPEGPCGLPGSAAEGGNDGNLG
jgi:hypothetical protein